MFLNVPVRSLETNCETRRDVDGWKRTRRRKECMEMGYGGGSGGGGVGVFIKIKCNAAIDLLKDAQHHGNCYLKPLKSQEHLTTFNHI